jgi:hypothetical protein
MRAVPAPPPQHDFLSLLAQYRLNEYSDILGLCITIVGFGFTFWKLRRTRKAAEAARDAAREAQAQVTQLGAVIALQEVLTEMEDVKTLLRQQAWSILVVHLPKMRRVLIQIRESAPNLGADAQKSFQGAIASLRTFEERAHRLLSGGASDPDIPRMIGKTISNIDNLNGTLQQMRNAAVRRHDHA